MKITKRPWFWCGIFLPLSDLSLHIWIVKLGWKAWGLWGNGWEIRVSSFVPPLLWLSLPLLGPASWSQGFLPGQFEELTSEPSKVVEIKSTQCRHRVWVPMCVSRCLGHPPSPVLPFTPSFHRGWLSTYYGPWSVLVNNDPFTGTHVLLESVKEICKNLDREIF